MVKTIGNPLSWSVGALEGAGRGASHLAERLGGVEESGVPVVRKIGTEDLKEALRRGVEDFAAFRSDVVAICLLYPVIGGVLVWFALDRNLLPLLFPMLSGFALVGPLAGVGLYEMSRRRERGLHPNWGDALAVFRSSALAPIVMLGIYLLAIFVAWLFAAWFIYAMTLGPEPPASTGAFLADVFTTGAGWAMIVLGFGVGFVFAVVALAISVVSFPMLLDRDVGLPLAVVTSVTLVARNPWTMAQWGLVVALSLALGAIPALLGLALVVPILGHATWHLYRRAIDFEAPNPKPNPDPAPE
ncbi:DUF2189 domain-containing protein [Rhodobacteraceae bacterium 2CG4]|uniref:DUF2189 domain-containing protein n=1 Tax=Halovulum marinum TaxID=2662447 RepID=A0A6L5Z4M6_9RHOB|nr:DUF2189 domain-containing protein [Halovulum marinum]MSU91407.1 DUF2189 domain-containing protein [Halovulum marinum]